MKGYRRKVGTRFHVEHDPLVADLDRRTNAITGTVAAYIAVAVTAASAAYSAYSANEAAIEQKRIANANAERIRRENEEALKRLKKQQAANLAEARARAAASGVTTEGTQKTYLEEMKDAFKNEVDWLRSSGASQAVIAQQEGYLRADITRTQGISQGLSKVGSSMSYWSSAG